VLVEGCARRGLDPVPFLLALACAANVGSAATLIGNPQNMLIGQALGLSFGGYALVALVPALLGLAVVWAVVWARQHGRWAAVPAVRAEAGAREEAARTAAPRAPDAPDPAWNRWQVIKGLAVLAGLLAAFLLAPWPRDIVALGAAGVLLASRRMASRDTLGLVDWQLLVLFAGLFVVNRALADAGWPARALAGAAAGGVDLTHPGWLFGAAALLSNLVSNVPATMLLLPAATHPQAGPVLALASTLAGNLLVVGSIANIIVLDQAARLGVRIGWRDHARVGVPVTVATLAITAAWLWALCIGR